MTGCPGRSPLLLNPSMPAAQASRLPTTARPFSTLFGASRGPRTIFHDWLAAGSAATAVPAPRLTRLEANSAPIAASDPVETARRRRLCLVRQAAMEPPEHGAEVT